MRMHPEKQCVCVLPDGERCQNVGWIFVQKTNTGLPKEDPFYITYWRVCEECHPDHPHIVHHEAIMAGHKNGLGL